MNFNRGADPKSSMGIGRGKYSKKEFEGYKFRAVIIVSYIHDKEVHETVMNIFTDQKDKNKFYEEIWSRRKDHVTSITIEHWSSALQDKLNEEFIKETLNIS